MSSNAVTWTVREVLKKVPELGIPHFQRGLVWSDESVASLLESLFYETPCGSFVLWSPKDCASMGVPLDEAVCTGVKYLVIDGQQRIRSLHSVFNERPQTEVDVEETGGQDEYDGGLPRVWCINLPKAAGYTDLLPRQLREFSLFVYTADPLQRAEEKQTSPLKYNVLPLSAIEQAEDWFSPSLNLYRDLIRFGEAKSLSAEERDRRLSNLYQGLRKSVLGMKSQTFFVSIQYKNDPAEMANLYNRINAGGKRVETEERAFARLVGLQPSTYGELRKMFDLVHGKGPVEELILDMNPKINRDDVLRRQKERAFGFKLFIRVFLQVCQHHLGLHQNKSDFSFDLASKASFLESFRKLKEPQVVQLWEETSRAVEHVRGVLRNELVCDDLRSLPETMALTPLFQLLIHYPGLRGDVYRPLLASLCLRLMLAELDSRTVSRLVQEAGDPGRVAFTVIASMLKTLDGRVTESQLASRLQQANSIQSRYVLMLYWLERRLKAKDFLYANVPNPKRPTCPERLIEEKEEPEKQHLLPFKKAQTLYAGDLRRGGSHLVNSIGNLTYISSELNGFRHGLGDSFADLTAEPDENKQAHLLCDAKSGNRVLDDYERLRARLTKEGGAGTGGMQKVFEGMTRRRRTIILAALQEWLADLDRQTCDKLGVSSLQALGLLAGRDDRLEPAPPEVAPLRSQNVAYIIRKLGLSHQDEDRVVHLAQRAARIPTRKDDKLECDLWFTKTKPRVWVAARQGGVALRFAPDVAQEHRQEIVEALGLDDEGDALPDAIPLKPVPDFQPLLEVIKVLGPELEAKSGTSTQRQEGRGRFWAAFSEFLRQQPDATFQLENPPKKGTTRLFVLNDGGVLKGRFSVARGSIETYLRLKGAGSAQTFDALQRQREDIEKAIGAELRWQEQIKDEKYQIGLEMDSTGTGADDRAEQYEWLYETAKRFIEVFGPRLKAIA